MARRRVALATMAAAIALVVAGAGPARGHHVGAYVPRDNDVSANFKQLKFSLQAGKFEVAGRLYETGALKRELRARAASLPPALESRIREALKAGDARAADDAAPHTGQVGRSSGCDWPHARHLMFRQAPIAVEFRSPCFVPVEYGRPRVDRRTRLG